MAIVIEADGEDYRSGKYDGALLYTAVSRTLHHLSLFVQPEFSLLLGPVTTPQAGLHQPPPRLAGRSRKAGQERDPGANHTELVRTPDGRFDSSPGYESDGARDKPWSDR